MRISKRDAQRELEIRASLKNEISAGVQAELEKRRVSPSKFLRVVGIKSPQERGFRGLSTACALSYEAFRKKMVREGRWQPAYEILSQERFAQIYNARLKSQERRSQDDPGQQKFDFAVFEHIPRRMHIEWDTVEEYLVRFQRYKKRVNRNALALEDMTRIAGLVHDQPPEMDLPEALERVTGDAKKAAAKP